MSIGERYHGAARRLWEKLKATHADLDDLFLLDAPTKATNDPMDEDGLTPTLLVYGAHAKLPLQDAAAGATSFGDLMTLMRPAGTLLLELAMPPLASVSTVPMQPSLLLTM